MKSLSELFRGILYPEEAKPPFQFLNTQSTLPSDPKEPPTPKAPMTAPDSGKDADQTQPDVQGQKAA